MSKFGPQTALVVGPGFKKALLPGYPAQEDAVILQSDVEGRPLREIDFSNAPLIGRFHVFDYFGDGSLYVLDAPGVSHLFLPCFCSYFLLLLRLLSILNRY